VIGELVVNVAIPSVVLLWLSSDDYLGPLWALVLALLPPLAWGVGSMVRAGKVSGLAVIAFGSVLLTGGVGLFELDPEWIAIKEALVPTLFGLATLASASTRYAVVPTLLARMFDLARVERAVVAAGHGEEWAQSMAAATRQVGLLFLLSAASSYALARYLVVSPAGTEAFNNELGWMTMWSIPAVMVPVTLGMAFVLSRLLTRMEAFTGSDYESFLLAEASADEA
jgi:hypothetical protein